MFYKTKYSSKFLDIILVSDEESITGLWIGEKDSTNNEEFVEDSNHPILKIGTKWLDAYFENKKPSTHDLPLNPLGSFFRKTVWDLLLKIPYGELTTYSDLAKEVAKIVGKDKMSAEAIGGAVSHNPISIIIPCHRVVGKNGCLTGYSGGLDNKIKLLTHEEVDMSKLYLPK